jgi:chromosome segregation ATPase
MAFFVKLDNLHRQEEIHTNLISSLKARITELEHQVHNHTHREPELLHQLKDSQLRVTHLETDNRHLRAEIEKLHARVADLDRLKHLEQVLGNQPEKWAELGALAESMKSLTRSVAANRSSTDFNY